MRKLLDRIHFEEMARPILVAHFGEQGAVLLDRTQHNPQLEENFLLMLSMVGVSRSNIHLMTSVLGHHATEPVIDAASGPVYRHLADAMEKLASIKGIKVGGAAAVHEFDARVQAVLSAGSTHEAWKILRKDSGLVDAITHCGDYVKEIGLEYAIKLECLVYWVSRSDSEKVLASKIDLQAMIAPRNDAVAHRPLWVFVVKFLSTKAHNGTHELNNFPKYSLFNGLLEPERERKEHYAVVREIEVEDILLNSDLPVAYRLLVNCLQLESLVESKWDVPSLIDASSRALLKQLIPERSVEIRRTCQRAFLRGLTLPALPADTGASAETRQLHEFFHKFPGLQRYLLPILCRYLDPAAVLVEPETSAQAESSAAAPSM